MILFSLSLGTHTSRADALDSLESTQAGCRAFKSQLASDPRFISGVAQVPLDWTQPKMILDNYPGDVVAFDFHYPGELDPIARLKMRSTEITQLGTRVNVEMLPDSGHDGCRPW